MQPPHGGAPGDGGGVAPHPPSSLQDMQRFQQQLQAQYRQQQQQQGMVVTQQPQFGGAATSASQLAAMHQHQQQSVSSMNHTHNALATMMHSHNSNLRLAGFQQQQQPVHGMSFNNNTTTAGNTGMTGGNMANPSMGMSSSNNIGFQPNTNNTAFGNFNWVNHMQQQQHQPQQAVPSAMDASSGSSARLMAMSGMGGNAATAFAPSGMHGLGGNASSCNAGSSMSNVAGGNTGGGTALQNMQAALLQQQQQQQANLGNAHSQQQQRQMMLSGIPPTFNAIQQQQQTVVPSAALTMGMHGMGLPNSGAAGNATTAQQQQLLFQQQLAAIQNQHQMSGNGSLEANAAMAAMQSSLQQQGGGSSMQLQQQQPQNSVGGSTMSGQNALSSLQQQQGVSHQSLLQARQQQLLQQMQQQQQLQQQRNISTGDSSTGSNITSAGGMLQQMQQQRNSGKPAMLQQMASSTPGLMSMMQQPPQLAGIGQQHVSGMVHGGQHQVQTNANDNAIAIMGANYQQQGLMGNHNNLSGMSNHGNSNGDQQKISGQMHYGNSYNDHGGLNNLNASASMQACQQQHIRNSSGTVVAEPSSSGVTSSDQASFLDGRFAGGWQSNADLPERRRVIFNILEVIRQMRPDTSKLSNKLPHMAKSLEEHLYRSAKSKEDYMDLSTLKKRLQAIAHGLEIHRSSDIKQMDSSTGSSQHGTSTHDNAAKNGGAITAAGQNANWSVAAAVRSNVGGTQGLSCLATQLNSAGIGNMNPAAQLSSSKHESTSIVNAALQSNVMSHQGNIQGNSNSLGNQTFLALPGQQQVTRQQSDLWAAGQSSGTGNVMEHQHQGNSILMNQRNSGIAGGLQHNAVHLMNTNTSDDRHDHFSSNTNVSTTQPTFSNASAASTQLEREQSSSNTWGSLGGVTANSSVSGNSEYPNSSKFQDPIASQKKRVILQQQQRLLLLRHASKCNAGPQCSTKFCEQMVTLWKHMKTCRNKNCKTSHCLSSRCVLNHYRICKSNGRTSTCEVCGPVMLKIKQQESDDGSVEDPLTRDQDPIPLSPEQIPATIATLALCQNQPNLGDQAQLQQAQEQQSKLKALFDSLKLLQRQQEQLLEQQKILEAQAQSISDPNSAQARQLKEQQTLLQQLHKRCQQQQLLVQQELQMQAATANESEGHLFPGIEDTDVGQIIPSDKANTIVSQDSQMLRRGSGIGKRFGKALALPASLKSSGIEEPSGKKKRGSITKTERSTKKARAANKQKAILTHEKWKPEMNSAALTTKMDDEHTSLVSRMTTAEIQKHLESLNKRIILSSRTVTHKCRPIIQELIDDQFGWVFRDAVDPVALGLPDYYDVIKNPMHLDLVRKKLENAIYSDMEGFARDTRLVFENAILYNGDSSEVGELAQCMLLRFEKIYNSVVQDIESSHINLESQGELCSLCGVQKRRFEPTVLYCQGKCGMQRIKRNAPYFTDRTKQNHWCDSCFAVLEPGEPIILDDGTEVLKRELQEFKNDALPEEGWVNCDECHSWVHQVCALFNGRTNKSSARFACPSCYLKMSIPEETREKAKKCVKGAQELARCKMSDAIEKGLNDALQAAYATRSSEVGVAIDEIEKAEGLTVRVLSNVEKKHFVGEKMFQRYEAQGYPGEFPLRSKCVALFQKIHGVDTLLFAMYVYEYGHDSPAPNKRRVYISYLDSVQYFEPKCYRTTAYHAIIIEYLGYVKRRGFHTAAIWSCPPVGGDDYVFYCHPKHQLVPREDMLRSWYHKMLDQAKLQGIVIRTTTLHDEYFASDSVDSVRGEKRDLTCLPYFDGDYLPGEIENIIQQLECAGNSRIATTQDNVMVRVGHNLRKMKDNFIVVHLRNRRFAAAVERGEDVSNWKEDSDDDMLRSKRAKISGKCSAELDAPIKNLPSESVASLESMTMDDRSVISSGGDISTATPLNDGISIKKDSIKVSRELKGTGIISKDEISMSAQAKSEAVARDDADVCQFKVAGDARMSLPVSGNVAKKEPPVFELTKGHKSERLERFDDLSRLDIVDNFAVSSGNNLDTTVGLRRESARTGIEDEPSPSTGNQNSKIVSSVGLECGTVSVGDDKAGSCSRDGVAVDPLNRDCVEQAAVRGIEGERLGQVTSYPTVASVVNTDASEADNMVAHIDCVEARDRWDAKFAIKKENTSLFPTESDKVLPGVAGSEIEIAPSSKSIDAERDSNKSSQDDSGDVDELQALKRALEVIKPAVSLHFSGLNRPAAQVGDTVDEDPPMESEIFESRQQFLNYCQTTHCQFDELRRAKHSTMMLLFQLHNPMAPKFLQQCGACYRDITHGFRYHCKVCSNFDLCEECYEPVTSGVWAKRDPRFAHEKTHSFTPINTEVLEETQKSRAERQKSLKAHIELLEHAGTCLGPPGCSLHNCERMKKLFLHVPSCDVQPKKECKICTRLLALCTMHSRLCAARGPCPIPFCDRIRERNRRLRRQQKLMDDRRRQAQNELYHAGGEA